MTRLHLPAPRGPNPNDVVTAVSLFFILAALVVAGLLELFFG